MTTNQQILTDLRHFIKQEQEINLEKLMDIWQKPLDIKCKNGESQKIKKIDIEDRIHLRLSFDCDYSRFRTGDMICLHQGDALQSIFVRQAMLVKETNQQWLIKVRSLDEKQIKTLKPPFYADPDGIDLTLFFENVFTELSKGGDEAKNLLDLIDGRLQADDIYIDNFDNAADIAEQEGFNEQQIEAVGYGVGAKYLACIQGPAGTGKTRVISLIAKLLVDEGQAVLVTSHTHMAINNMLNKIYQQQVPLVKVGSSSSGQGLDRQIKLVENIDLWLERPDHGYVIGATPFATCTSRLQGFKFDTVIFDEASQVTTPLALMAMRTAKRFIFVGDHQQLPPIILSKSVLDTESAFIFAQLFNTYPKTTVMLAETYRMNKTLTAWSSQAYYAKKLFASEQSAHRQFKLPKKPLKYQNILTADQAFIYLQSPSLNKRTVNPAEADLVADIIYHCVEAGLESSEIGVVTPYRKQAKQIRNALKKHRADFFKTIVADTVERMQGQERELIIISCCSTDLLFIKNIAGFFFQPQRLNVAITRPKTKLILIAPRIDFVVDDAQINAQIKAYHSLINSAYHGDKDDSRD